MIALTCGSLLGAALHCGASGSSAYYARISSGFAARFGVKEITGRELMDRLRQKAPTLLIDVRAAHEQKVSVIPGAIRLQPGEIARVRHIARGAQPGTMLVFYCTAGYRSSQLASRLRGHVRDRQLQVRNLKGGLITWVNQRHPVVDPQTGRELQRVHGYTKTWARFVHPRRGLQVITD